MISLNVVSSAMSVVCVGDVHVSQHPSMSGLPERIRSWKLTCCREREEEQTVKSDADNVIGKEEEEEEEEEVEESDEREVKEQRKSVREAEEAEEEMNVV